MVQQVVALTPPDLWPIDALDAVVASDWSAPLLAGLGQSAASYAHADWCERLLDLSAHETGPLNAQALFAALPQARAEQVYRSVLQSSITAATMLAGVRREDWSPDFSAELVRTLFESLARWGYTAAGLLRELPLQLDPSVAPAVHAALDHFEEPAWAWPYLERLAGTLEIRAAMRHEVQS
jgi:hypothetical protein